MLTKVSAAALQGIDATLITIEVNSQKGCGFSLVGLPDSAVRESIDRALIMQFDLLPVARKMVMEELAKEEKANG